MDKFTASEAQNNFGKFIDNALREPTVIEKHGRPVIVAMSHEQYQDLCILALREMMRESEENFANGKFTTYTVEQLKNGDLLREILGEGAEDDDEKNSAG